MYDIFGELKILFFLNVLSGNSLNIGPFSFSCNRGSLGPCSSFFAPRMIDWARIDWARCPTEAQNRWPVIDWDRAAHLPITNLPAQEIWQGSSLGLVLQLPGTANVRFRHICWVIFWRCLDLRAQMQMCCMFLINCANFKKSHHWSFLVWSTSLCREYNIL